MKKAGKVIAIVCGVLVVLVFALQMVVNMPFVSRKVNEIAAKSIDGNLSYSNLHISLIKEFPKIRASVDSLSLTYPHDRFARYDRGYVRNRLLNAGRGETADTLLRFDYFTVAVNPWTLLSGLASLDEVELDGAAVYAHQYDTTANWTIFKPSEKENLEEKSSASFPGISIGRVNFGPRTRIVYTDCANRLYSLVDLKKLLLEGDAVADSSGIQYINMFIDMSVAIDELVFPLSMEARVGFDALPSVTEIDLPSLSANVAYVPLEANGNVHLLRDSVRLKLDATVRDCDFGKVVMTYGPDFVDMLKGVPVKGRIEAGVQAEGLIAENVKPKVNAAVSLDADVPGASVRFVGKAKGLLGKDPSFDVHAKCLAALDSFARFIPDSTGVEVSGDCDLKIDAVANMSEIKTGKFRKAEIAGQILSDKILFVKPADSLKIATRSSVLSFKSNPEGLGVTAGFGRAFVKSDESRIGLKDINVGASIQKRVRPKRTASSDSLFRSRMNRLRMEKIEDDELSKGDISLVLDSTVNSYFRQWEPSGSISAGNGFFSSPAIPLRTRLSVIEGKFTGNEINLDTLQVQMGTSDIEAKGRISSIRRALRKRGPIKVDFSLESQRLNVNEILVALQKGKTVTDSHPDSENEGSFVVDSIAGADISNQKMSLIIVPGNVDAMLGIKAERVDYSDIRITPLAAQLRMKDRTLQLSNADAVTNLGGIHMDAFYSTRSKSDISAGLGMKLYDVSAHGIIHLLPTVDDMMPALKSFEGNLGLELSATTKIDTNMNVVLPSLDGILRISGKDLYVRDAGNLKKITRLLMFRNKDIGQIQNLSVDAVVHDSKLEVFPFELDVDRYKLALRGMQDLDGKLNYHVSVMKSPFLIPFGINIFGYTDNWRFSLGLAKYHEGKVPVYSRQLDTMQVNIVKSIKDVFSKGAKYAREQANRKPVAVGADNAAASFNVDNLQQFDVISYDIAAALAEEQLDAEVEAALSENVIDMNKLILEYEAANIDRRIELRIKKLKK